MVSFFQTVFFLRRADEKLQKGFTLVELLVVISISMVIGAAAIMNFTGGERANAVTRAADLILTKVRSVQNKATTVAQGNGNVPCGYGLHYQNETSLKIFSVSPKSSFKCAEINSSGSDENNRRYGSTTESISSDLETVELKRPNVVKIDPFPDIYFVPPEGLVFIDGERQSGNFSTIIVCERTRCSENSKEIKISTGGEIILEK